MFCGQDHQDSLIEVETNSDEGRECFDQNSLVSIKLHRMARRYQWAFPTRHRILLDHEDETWYGTILFIAIFTK